MNMRLRYVLLLVVWVLGVGSCIVWGQDQLWIAGLSITVVSLATLAAAYFTDVGEQDKRRFTVGGAIFLIVGLGLLYVGLTNPQISAAFPRVHDDAALSRFRREWEVVRGSPVSARGPGSISRNGPERWLS